MNSHILQLPFGSEPFGFLQLRIPPRDVEGRPHKQETIAVIVWPQSVGCCLVAMSLVCGQKSKAGKVQRKWVARKRHLNGTIWLAAANPTLSGKSPAESVKIRLKPSCPRQIQLNPSKSSQVRLCANLSKSVNIRPHPAKSSQIWLYPLAWMGG